MFTPFVLIYTFLLISAVRCSTDPAPTVLNITDEVCLDSGFWTDWFSMYNAQSGNPPDAESTYNTLMDIANASCSTIAAFQLQQIVEEMSGGNMPRSLSNLDVISVFLSAYAEALSQINFRLRFCCSDGFTGMSTTSDEPGTEQTTAATHDSTILDETTSSRTTTGESTLMSLDDVICGKQQIDPRPSLTSRIFGGTDAIANSWPWMINYRLLVPCGNKMCGVGCGGTLISKNYVLTAAHCIETDDTSAVTLTAGMQTQSSFTEENTRQVRAVQSIHIHPRYNAISVANDIALLRVETPFEYTPYVQPACLPGTDPQPNDEVLIIGWGSEKLDDYMVDTLKQAPTTVVGNCNRFWPQVNSRQQICVANTKTGDSACQGDSGGPILNQNNGQYVVSGVASYSHNCKTAGRGTTPNVYTRVSAYKSWIESVVDKQP